MANYNEEDDEDEFAEEEDEMTSAYWANAVEDSGPVIDKILDHRPKDGLGNREQSRLVSTLANEMQRLIHPLTSTILNIW